MISDANRKFISEHKNDDIRKLAFKKTNDDIDLAFCLSQIQGRRIAEKKIPEWAENENIIYPPHLSMEQCSSQQTAELKREIINKLIDKKKRLIDLTGGFGVDASFIAKDFEQLIYVERNSQLCEIAAHNIPYIYKGKLTIENGEAEEIISKLPSADIIFIDPARRDARGGKTVLISDCQPDVCKLEEELINKADYVLVKLSPMLDISLAASQLKYIRDIHIVSLKGECKELLFVLSKHTPSAKNYGVHTVNILSSEEKESLDYHAEEEENSKVAYSENMGVYIYEPNASIMKAGAYKLLCQKFNVEKIAPNSHLYTSDEYQELFPGRRFRIIDSCSMNKKELRDKLSSIKKANITVRNFPIKAEELRKKLKLSDGGDVYIFATTDKKGNHILIIAKKM